MVLAVDFDGVIHNEHDVAPGYKMGKPMPGALETILRWLEGGHTIIIHTSRAQQPAGAQAVAKWLAYFKFPEMPITATKINADYYLDDKAVRFVDWEQAKRDIHA